MGAPSFRLPDAVLSRPTVSSGPELPACEFIEHEKTSENARTSEITPRPLIEATFQGPNECCELLAMRLHQMGAAKAKQVVFLSDGAPWIWERLVWIEKRVGIKSKRV